MPCSIRKPSHLAILSLACCLSPLAVGGNAGAPFEEMLQKSMQDKKGIYLFVGDQKIGGRVTGFPSDDVVELTSQEFGQIQVRRERIDAVAAY